MGADDSEPGDPTSLVEALAAGPPVPDPVAMALLRAQVLSTLFDRAPDPVTIGRFRVIDRIGRGGMGRVYLAHDPDLDRRIALKLVPAGEGAARERLLGEAQALARLSHPNVVPVHDVEVVGDQVCIVMEFVSGQTLRAWRAEAPRSWREVLAVYRQVGEGLEAAHRAGLVHRDVKPENAIVGADGRVRVVDFGLARPLLAAVEAGPAGVPSAAVTHPAGTPRYMAPEQSAGGPVTAAADQYAFCASLREALDGEAPWLAPALERGTAADPAARFPSMAELLRLLARDPVAIRRRRLVATGVVLLLAGGGAVAGALAARAPAAAVEPCSGGADEIAAVWSGGRRADVAAAIAAGDAYRAALAPRVVDTLDHYAARWAAGHRAACLAHRRGEQTDAVLDRRMACLARGKSALGAVTELLGRRGDTRPDAALAAAALPGLGACDDVDRILTAAAPPPAAIAAEVARLDGELERARVLAEAGQAAEGRDVAAAVVATARKLAYPPLLARGLAVLGRAGMQLAPLVPASAALREATLVALRTGDDALAVEAYARRAWVESMDRRDGQEDALDGLAVIEALADRIADGAFVRALLHNNVFAVESAAGHRDRALAALDRALREADQVPEPVPVELLRIRGNLGIYERDPIRREAIFAATADALSARLGAEHPMTLRARIRAALPQTDPAASAAALAPVCETFGRLHPAYGFEITSCWFELGLLAYMRRDLPAAARAFAAAAAAQSTEAEWLWLSRGYLALARGEHREAASAFDRVLAAVPEGGAWWSRRLVGDARFGRGLARRGAGDRRGAAADLAAAEALFGPVAEEMPHAYITRRLAAVRAERAPTSSR